MKTLRQLKLKEHDLNKQEISLSELKGVLYTYYYPDYKRFTFNVKKDIEQRELIITEIKNGYGNIYTVIFSLEGSPPKGEGILQTRGMSSLVKEEYWEGKLILLGNGKTSTPVYMVKILKEKQK